MTKLEEKLNELGYKPYDDFMLIRTFIKIYNDKWNLIMETGLYETKVIECYVDLDAMTIHTQQDIDDLQQAFNVLQKDLEKLRQIESKENLKECIKALNDDFWD